MKTHRILILGLIAFVTLGGVACTDVVDPAGSVQPQYARHSKPPKTTGSPVQLLEYYIYKDASGQNFIHILAKGSFTEVNLNAVQDYIFNGIRDDDNSIYYEYTTFAPAPVAVSDLEAQGLAETDPETGALHMDIPWNGETTYGDYSDPDNPVEVPTVFPDLPYVNVDGTTGDPYAFDVRFQSSGSSLLYVEPQGIILDGVETHEPVMDPASARLHPGVSRVASYATYESDRTGKPVYIDQFSVDESSLTCTVTRTHDHKTKTTTTITQVSATARVVLSDGVSGDPVPEGWLDVKFARPTGDPSSPEILDSFASTSGADAWADGWTVSTQLDGAIQGPIQLQLAVPYVYATDLETPTVYAPNLNKGNSSWSTLNQEGTTTLGTWPIAITTPFTVNCGK